jgi:hypothetical protein
MEPVFKENVQDNSHLPTFPTPEIITLNTNCAAIENGRDKH